MRTTLALILLLIGGLMSVSSLRAQSFGTLQPKMLPAQYEAEASRLRAANPQQYDFSKAMLLTERRNASRLKRGERCIWQRRHWESRIRDEADFLAHMNHINPVKRGRFGGIRCFIAWCKPVLSGRLGEQPQSKPMSYFMI